MVKSGKSTLNLKQLEISYMNYKVLFFGFLIMFTTSLKTIAQNKSNSPIEKSINSFNSLSNVSSKYELDFIEKKNTLYFKYELGENKKFGFKAILKDIHPEGIFIIERENIKYLRILSIHNGKVFVREVLRGQFWNSNNTNIIEIQLPENINDKDLTILVENLKSIFIKEEKEVPLQIVEPPKTKME